MANLEQANEYQHSPNSQLIDLVVAPSRGMRSSESPADRNIVAEVNESMPSDPKAEDSIGN